LPAPLRLLGRFWLFGEVICSVEQWEVGKIHFERLWILAQLHYIYCKKLAGGRTHHSQALPCIAA
jgi:hypothetical protein